MAVLSTQVALNMDDWNLGNPVDGPLGPHNGRHFTVEGDGPRTYDFGGRGFHYFGFGDLAVPTSGEVRSLTIADSGNTNFTLTGISIDVPVLYGFLGTNQYLAFEAYVLADDDTITGSAQNDVLNGFTGDDTIAGAQGADSLNGGLGVDHLTGGAAADKFVFTLALESTSSAYDHVTDFDAGLDHFVFAEAVTGVDTAIVGGRLSKNHFDSNLAQATDDGVLDGHHAVLFTPDAGRHAGETLLIVDLDGIGGYLVGVDAVIQLDDTSHLAGLSAANFLVD